MSLKRIYLISDSEPKRSRDKFKESPNDYKCKKEKQLLSENFRCFQSFSRFSVKEAILFWTHNKVQPRWQKLHERNFSCGKFMFLKTNTEKKIPTNSDMLTCLLNIDRISAITLLSLSLIQKPLTLENRQVLIRLVQTICAWLHVQQVDMCVHTHTHTHTHTQLFTQLFAVFTQTHTLKAAHR